MSGKTSSHSFYSMLWSNDEASYRKCNQAPAQFRASLAVDTLFSFWFSLENTAGDGDKDNDKETD